MAFWALGSMVPYLAHAASWSMRAFLEMMLPFGYSTSSSVTVRLPVPLMKPVWNLRLRPSSVVSSLNLSEK